MNDLPVIDTSPMVVDEYDTSDMGPCRYFHVDRVDTDGHRTYRHEGSYSRLMFSLHDDGERCNPYTYSPGPPIDEEAWIYSQAVRPVTYPPPLSPTRPCPDGNVRTALQTRRTRLQQPGEARAPRTGDPR